MIHWLLQSAPITEAVEDFLSPAEYHVYRGLVNKKRQQDWLLGRWTAKNLLQRVVAQSGRGLLPLNVVAIHSDAAGAPVVDAPGVADLSLTISHSCGCALCAVVNAPAWPLGADMERIETRPLGFVVDYFSPEEQWLVEKANADMRDVLVTAIWSAKESVLKALHVGLSVDTRSVTCVIHPEHFTGTAWNPFDIYTDNCRLKREAPPLQGWWRVDGDFVLTLVCRPNDVTA